MLCQRTCGNTACTRGWNIRFLSKNFDSLADSQLVSFAKRYPNTLMADELNTKLTKRFVDKAQWADLLAFIPNNPDDTTFTMPAQSSICTNNPSAALAFR